MKKLITVLLCFLVINSFSQVKVRKVINKNESRRYNEVYYVKKKSKNIRHGEYVKTSFKGKILEKGNYSHGMKVGLWEKNRYFKNYIIHKGYHKNGNRTGIWTFYDYNGRLKFKFDYDLSELIKYNWYKESDILKIKDKNGNWIQKKVDSPPIALDSDLRTFLVENVVYPVEARENGIQGTVIVAIIIDRNGNIKQYTVHKSAHEILDNECLKLIKSIDQWYPAILKEEKVECEYLIPQTFKLN